MRHLSQQDKSTGTCLSSIPWSLEIKIQSKNTTFKGAPKSVPRAMFPFSIDDVERNCFIWRTRLKSKYSNVWILGGRHAKCRRLGAVDKIWVENVEFISLHCLGRWSIM